MLDEKDYLLARKIKFLYIQIQISDFIFYLENVKLSMIGVMSFPDSQLILSDSFTKELCLVITNHANRL